MRTRYIYLIASKIKIKSFVLELSILFKQNIALIIY